MKLRSTFLLIVLLFVGSPVLFAKFVSKEDAKKIAYNFFAQNIENRLSAWDLDELNMTEVETRYGGNTPFFYVFSNNGKGFILVSADDRMLPVLGFSYEGNFPEQGRVEQLDYLLSDYQKEFEYAKTTDAIPAERVVQSREGLKTAHSPKSISNQDTIGPLIKSNWNQPYPYNAYCPADPQGSGGHAVTGCVATAMSQIMYYYRWPKTGEGQSGYYSDYGWLNVNYGATSYKWDAMQNTASSQSGNATISACAEIVYHCGVAVEMMYGGSSSGAYSFDVPDAITNHFRYSPSATYQSRDGMSWTNWENVLIAELDKKQPLYYAGCSDSWACHAWVCDGYTTSGSGVKYFHQNFGWGGSGNGYYIVSAPTGGGYSFTNNHNIVKNFIPDETYNPACDSRTLTSLNGSLESANIPRQNYSPNMDCQYLIAPTNLVSGMKLAFPYFDLDHTDTLYLYGGENTSAPLLGKYTGSKAPDPITSTSDKIFVVFKTDGANEKTGWQLEYTSIPTIYCSGLKIYNTPTGSFDDGSGTANYLNGSNCRWKIAPSGNAQNITLAFESFDLASTDFLEIRSARTNQIIAKLTGNQIPDPYTEPTGGFLLTFTSSASDPTASGFSVNYTSKIDAAGKATELENMLVFPNPSSGALTVEFSNVKGKDYAIFVKDLAGKTLFNQNFSGKNGITTQAVDLTFLRSGMYLLSVVLDGNVYNQKIVITR